MSNTYKFIIPAVILFSLISISLLAFTQLSKPEQKIVTNLNSTSQLASAIKSQFSVSSSQAVSSSTISSPVAQVVSSVKTESQVAASSPKVEFLDSNNPPQYIKDYLACPTKDSQSYVGFFDVQNNITKYHCAPDNENEYLCPEGVYEQKINSKGWKCYPRAVGLPFECDISLNNLINQNSDLAKSIKANYIKAKSIFSNQDENLGSCIIFTKKRLTSEELKYIISDNINNLKIINYFN